MKKEAMKTQTTEPPLRLDRLTCDELAHMERVRPCTIRSWTRLGLPYRPAGRLKFFDLAEVEQWLLARDQAKRAQKEQQTA